MIPPPEDPRIPKTVYFYLACPKPNPKNKNISLMYGE